MLGLLLIAALVATTQSTALLPKGPGDFVYPFVNYSVGVDCRRDFDRTIASFKKDQWALKMLDAFGKPEDSILEGNIRWAGEFDQCHSIQVEEANQSFPAFVGRYCWLTWTTSIFSKPFVFQSGGCIPSSCSEADALALLPYVIKYMKADTKKIGGMIRMDAVECLPEETTMSPAAWSTFYCLSAYVGLVMLFSAWDYWETSPDLKEDDTDDGLILKDKDSLEILHDADMTAEIEDAGEWDKKKGSLETGPRWKEILRSFSIFRSATSISENEEMNKQLAFLNGVRVLSFILILVVHSENCQRSIDRQILKHHEYAKFFSYQFLLAGHYAVETFFFISGFCFSYVFLKNGTSVEMTFKRFLRLVLNRYMRTSVPMLFLLVIHGVLVNYSSDGPLWQIQEASVEECPKIWWTFIFNIQNFFLDIRACVGWLWYVALDFQFYITGLCLLFVFHRSMGWGVMSAILLILGSTIANLVISYQNDLNSYQGYIVWSDISMKTFEEKLMIYFRDIYNKPYCRIGTYLVGLLYGLYAFRNHNISNSNNDATNPKEEMTTTTLIMGWSVAAFCFLGTLFFGYFLDLGVLGAAVNHAMYRYLWCVGLVWMFHLCLNDLAGWVGIILSCEAWATPSKLVYSAYLVHMSWLSYLFFSERQFTDYNPINLAMLELGSVVISFGLAFAFCLFFETPFVRLGKLLLVTPYVSKQDKNKANL